MDSKNSQQKGGASCDIQESSSKPDELQKTPSRPGRGTKRKLQSPSTPSPAAAAAAAPKDDAEKPGSAKRRRKSTSASGGTPLSRVRSPGSLLKPALTERQQMALLLQMTDPQKQQQQPTSSGAGTAEEVPTRLDTTPKSRVLRRNERGETPLHTACIKGDLKTAVSLIDQGAEVNATDHAGWMPLHEAANYGYDEIVMVLLNNGANVNARGMDGDIPLHDAAVNGHLQTVKVLLKFDADPNLANDKGITSVDICKDNKILKLLTTTEVIANIEKSHMESKEKEGGGEAEREEEPEKCLDEEIKTGAESTPPPCSPKTETDDVSDMDTEQVLHKAKLEVTTTLSPPNSGPLNLENVPPSAGTSGTAVSSGTAVGRKGARGRSRGRRTKGGFYSDISSSESESDYFEAGSKRRRRKGLLVERQTQRPLEGVSESQEETDEDVETGTGVGEEGKGEDKAEKSEEMEGVGMVSEGTGKDEQESIVKEKSESEKEEEKKGEKDKEKKGEKDKEKKAEKDKEKKGEKDKEKKAEKDKEKKAEKDKEKKAEKDKEKKGEKDKEKAEKDKEKKGEKDKEKKGEKDKEKREEKDKEKKGEKDKEKKGEKDKEKKEEEKTLDEHHEIGAVKSDSGQEPEVKKEPDKTKEMEGSSAAETPSSPVPERRDDGIELEASQEVAGSPMWSPDSRPEEQPLPTSPKTTTSQQQQQQQQQQEEEEKQEDKGVGMQQKRQQERQDEGKQKQSEQEKQPPHQQGEQKDEGVELQQQEQKQEQQQQQPQQDDSMEVQSIEGMQVSPLPSSVRPDPSTPLKQDSETDSDVDVDTTSSSPSHMLQTLPLPPHSSSRRRSDPEKLGLVVSVSLSLVTLTSSDSGRKSVSVPMREGQGSGGSWEGATESMEVNQPRAEPGSEVERSELKMQTRSVTRDPSLVQRKSENSPRDASVTTKTLEIRDVYSSQETRQSMAGRNGAPTDKQHHTKHSRKPQHVYSSKKPIKEGDRGQLECRETMESSAQEDDSTVSFSISVDWGVLSSQPMKAGGTKPGTTTAKDHTQSKLAGGRKKEDSGSHRSKASTNEEKTDDSDTSKSTIISLPTSLPIIFSGHPGVFQPLGDKSSGTVKQPGLLSSSGGIWAKDTLTTPPSSKPKTLPILLESVKSTLCKGSTQQPQTSMTIKDAAAQESEDDAPSIPLPPKKRYRGVQRSAVVQQRREKQGPPPSLPAQLSSFLMCTGDYRSKRPLQPTIPKSVYPPIHSAMHKLFSEQEAERIRLAAALLSEQDRLVLSMEQELVRAHQRATKCHTPISACAVLLERVLPRTNEQPAGAGEVQSLAVKQPLWESAVQKPEENQSFNPSKSDPALDARLLAGLVQDVWDKFYELKLSLLSQQRHETEALWMVQLDQWMDRLAELGFTKPATLHDIPPSHVPVTTSMFKGMNTLV